jgi:hypothetical protein
VRPAFISIESSSIGDTSSPPNRYCVDTAAHMVTTGFTMSATND